MSAPVAAGLAAVAFAAAVGALAARGRTAVLVGVDPVQPRKGRAGLFRAIGTSALARRLPRGRLHALASTVDSRWSVDELVGVKVVLAFALGAIALAGPMPVAAVPLVLLAWRGPELALARGGRRRLVRASAEVPLFLDLLAVATSAGLAPQAAVQAAVEPLEGPLAFELGDALRRTELGRRWRQELADVAERLGLGDLRRAATILARSESLGSALAGEISRLAADVREERRSRAAERARAAPVKMLFPLVFLILPAFLLLTVVPVLLSTVRSIV